MSSIDGSTLRITGMASGLDTETLVEELLSASKSKIASVEKKKILLEWKQEYYRETATDLYEFQNKYFNTASTLLSDDLTRLTATADSSYVTVTSTSASTAGNIYIDDIVSLASSAKLVSSYQLSKHPPIEIITENISDVAEKSMVIVLNGVERVITFSSDKTYATPEDVANELQAQLDKAFGSGNINVSLDSNIMTLSAENSTLIIKEPSDGSGTGPLEFGSYASNRAEMNISLHSAGLASEINEGDTFEFSVNGVNFSFTASDTLADILSAINTSDAGVTVTYSNITDKLTMVSNETGSASSIEINDISGDLMQKLFGEGVKTDGTDAVVRLSVDGSTNESDLITITRSSNVFDVNGTTIKLNGKASGTTKESININVDINTDSIIEKIKTFISDYNEVLSAITTKVTEEYDHDYLPLTSDEKAEMTEEEIELWTEKAKTGILQNDIYLESIANELRSIFYSPVYDENGDVIGTLADIGLSTSNYKDRGQISINETKLQDALNSDPDKVLALLTKKSDISYSIYASEDQKLERFNESGILERLSDSLATNLNNIGKKGALINLVGSPDNNFIGETDYGNRIQDLEDKIAEMTDDLYDEEDRYWAQFTAMETAIATLNQQSAWLSNMLGGTQTA